MYQETGSPVAFLVAPLCLRDGQENSARLAVAQGDFAQDAGVVVVHRHHVHCELGGVVDRGQRDARSRGEPAVTILCLLKAMVSARSSIV